MYEVIQSLLFYPLWWLCFGPPTVPWHLPAPPIPYPSPLSPGGWALLGLDSTGDPGGKSLQIPSQLSAHCVIFDLCIRSELQFMNDCPLTAGNERIENRTHRIRVLDWCVHVSAYMCMCVAESREGVSSKSTCATGNLSLSKECNSDL